MIRAVIDTNVLLSSFLTDQTPPGQILNAWRADRFDLVLSSEILIEVIRGFRKPYFRRRLTGLEILDAIATLHQKAILTPLTVEVSGVASHPEDDDILSTAVSAQVDYLVTGDAQLQRVGTYQGVKILSPLAFLNELHRLP